MRSRSVLVLVLVVVMAAAMATVASAAKPIKPPKPTTTTVPEPEYWTCEARNDNGAMWPIGTYADDAYHGDTVPVCIDINEKHRDVESWIVEWTGTTAKETVKGLKFVFEEEVHENVFAEIVVTEPISSSPWVATLDFSDGSAGNLVFVAMPHGGDKWTEFSIKVTPEVTPEVP